MSFSVILVHPEIPPNTGNIIRLCANTGSRLHLVQPMGFVLDDRRLRRAGLDYHEYAPVRVHPHIDAALAAAGGGVRYALTAEGETRYDAVRFGADAVFVFGCESRGLPAEVRARFPPERRLYLPLRPDNRSFNLSNAVAVTVMEAWRQRRFVGAAPAHGGGKKV